MSSSAAVQIIGAGISGLACARALQSRGVAARVVDRGRRAGGRMASRTIDGRDVDLGASYFTVEQGSAFEPVVADWMSRGIAREWTDAFAIAGPDGIRETRTGPMRYAAPGGLRSLVVDLADGLPVVQGEVVDRAVAPWTVLAMPDPQARRLLVAKPEVRALLDDGGGWEPVIAVALRWPTRQWPEGFAGAFVHDSPDISFIADDGSRRGDHAPVLVAHTTAGLAAQHLDAPDGAIEPATAAVSGALGIDERPSSTFAHRWTFAKPVAQHPEPFLLVEGAGIGVCGDAWGPKASVAAAWTSGDALGRELAARLQS